MALYAPSLPHTQDPPTMPRDPNWITTGEAGRILQMNPMSIRRWHLAGRLREMGIRTYQPGRHVYLWRPDVEAAARRAMSDPDQK